MYEKVIEFDIYNYYGPLVIKEDSGAYYWAVEDYNGYGWKPITKRLYDELLRFKEVEKQLQKCSKPSQNK